MDIFQSLKIGIIGCGNMGTPLVEYLAKSGHKEIYASDVDENRLEGLRTQYGIETTKDNRETADSSDVLVLAVKPVNLEDVLCNIRQEIKDKLVISIAAGKTLDFLERNSGHSRVIRTMPFMGYMFGYGATAYAMGNGCDEKDRAILDYVFNKGSFVFEVEEEQINAVTVLASMPGLLAKYLGTVNSAVEDMGLDRTVTRRYLANLLRTNAALIDIGEEFDDTYRRIASPKGTTQAGHEKALSNGFYEKAKEIVYAAMERCKELAK